MAVAAIGAVIVLALVLVVIAIAKRAACSASGDVENERLAVLGATPVHPSEAGPGMADIIGEAEEPAITWTAQLTTATLDEAARLRLIDGLVLLRPAWSVGLLHRAYEEERAPHVRARIEEALLACGEAIETTAY